MTVPSTARRAGPFLGNGVTTTFSFSFKTFAAGDLLVARTSTVGVETVLVKDSDYSVTLNGDQDTSPGGSITYPISGSPLAVGEKLTVVGALAYEQTTDLLGGGAFNARVIEDTFDRTVVQIQQLEERLDRALVLNVSTGASPELPAPAPLEVLGWNGTGTALVNVDPSDFLTIAGSSGFAIQQFSGTGAQTAFTLSAGPGAISNLEVFISGVRQVPTSDYTVSGTTLTFVSAPPAGTSNILARWGQTLGIGIPSDTSVSTTKIADQAVTTAKFARAAANQVLRATGTGSDPAWGKVNLTTDVTGTLPSANLADATDAAKGGVELATSAEVQTGTDTTRAITPASLRGGALVLKTKQTLLAVATAKFTGIPSWAKRVTVLFDRVSSSGTDLLTVKIFTAASVAASAYRSGAMNGSASGINIETSSSLFILEPSNAADATVERSGSMVLETVDGNTWVYRANLYAATKNIVSVSAGQATLGAALGEIEIGWTGSNQFDAPSVLNIMYE